MAGPYSRFGPAPPLPAYPRAARNLPSREFEEDDSDQKSDEALAALREKLGGDKRPRESKVSGALDSNDLAIDQLFNAVEALLTDLEPVLAPTPYEDDAAGEKSSGEVPTTPQDSDVVASIYHLTSRIYTLRNHVRTVHSRLEL